MSKSTRLKIVTCVSEIVTATITTQHDDDEVKMKNYALGSKLRALVAVIK